MNSRQKVTAPWQNTTTYITSVASVRGATPYDGEKCPSVFRKSVNVQVSPGARDTLARQVNHLVEPMPHRVFQRVTMPIAVTGATVAGNRYHHALGTCACTARGVAHRARTIPWTALAASKQISSCFAGGTGGTGLSGTTGVPLCPSFAPSPFLWHRGHLSHACHLFHEWEPIQKMTPLKIAGLTGGTGLSGGTGTTGMLQLTDVC